MQYGTIKQTVPTHLQDAHYKGAQKLGHGIGYKYAHDYPNHYVKQQYLPSEIEGTKFLSSKVKTDMKNRYRNI